MRTGEILSVATGDFNGDSQPDLVFRTWDRLSVLINTGAGNFSSVSDIQLPYLGGAADPLMADFNGDGILDLAFSDRNEMLFGSGDGTFPRSQPIRGEHPTFYGLTAVGDFNGDGQTDLVFFVRGSVAILLGNGNGTFRLGAQGEIGDGLLYVADFNRDGRSDLALLHSGTDCRMRQRVAYGKLTWVCRSDDFRVFLAQSDGSFSDPVQTPSIEVNTVHITDFNDDGLPDMATINTGSGDDAEPVILLGNGDGSFRVSRRIFAEYDTVAVWAADIRGDAHLELVTIGRDEEGGNGISVLPSDASRRGQPASSNWLWLYVWETVDRRVGGIADFDGDGRLDLVTAVYAVECASPRGTYCSDQSNKITVLLNRTETIP